MKEAINLYEEAGHRQRMEAGQQALINGHLQLLAGQNQIVQGQNMMIKQLEYGNLLKVQQIHLQRTAISAVQENTAAVHQNTAAVERGLSQVAHETERGAKKIQDAIDEK